MLKKLKILSIIFSYGFFIIVIIISINAVVPVPDEEILTLEQKEILIKKVDNNFSRNKNSVYEILESNDEKKNARDFTEQKVETKNDDEKLKSSDEIRSFRIQFASFKEKQKSIKISNELKTKLSNMSMEIGLDIKKVKINDNDTFFRIISTDKYSYNDANKECKKLKKMNIQCIIIKS